MKQVFFRISSFCCFSLLRSANVSMMTPKIRLRTMMMTMKKNRRSYTTRATNKFSCNGKKSTDYKHVFISYKGFIDIIISIKLNSAINL